MIDKTKIKESMTVQELLQISCDLDELTEAVKTIQVEEESHMQLNNSVKEKVMDYIVTKQDVTVAELVKQFGIGFNEARQIFNWLCSLGIVTPSLNSNKRHDIVLENDSDNDPLGMASFGWIWLNARNGKTWAIYSLANCYVSGIGVSKDLEKAIELMLSVDNETDAESIFGVGEMYEHGTCGYAIDYDQAFVNYSVASHLGESQATYNLAHLYEQGLGAEQDYKKATELYKKAYDQLMH